MKEAPALKGKVIKLIERDNLEKATQRFADERNASQQKIHKELMPAPKTWLSLQKN